MASQTFDDVKLVKQIFDQQGQMNSDIEKTVTALADYAPQIKQNTERLMSIVPENQKYKLREKSDKVLGLIGTAYKEFKTYKALYNKRNVIGEYVKNIEDKGVFQNFMMKQPSYSNEVRKPQDVVKLYNKLLKEERAYAAKFGKVWKEFMSNSQDLTKMTQPYMSNMDHKTTKGEEAVMIGFVGAFASAVIYFLVGTNPASIVANFSGVVSPLPLAVISGAVILFLFFATHHKLHK